MHVQLSALLLTLAPLLASAAEPVAYEVAASQLHVRSGPGTQASSLGLLERGQAYAGETPRSGWVRLELGGRSGWASAHYLIPSARPLLQVQADVLRVRSGPGLNYRVLGHLSRGVPVVELARERWWVQIGYEGTRAWVHGDHVRSWPQGQAWHRGAARPGPSSAPARPRSSAGFIQLAASGVGFESYTSADRRWGVPRLVYALERAARRWAQLRSDRMGIGTLSRAAGGYLPPHSSHRDGVDVDLAPVRSDGRELPVTVDQAAYSRTWTTRMLDLIRSELAVALTLFNDAGVPGTQSWPGHDNHLHVRVR